MSDQGDSGPGICIVVLRILASEIRHATKRHVIWVRLSVTSYPLETRMHCLINEAGVSPTLYENLA